MGATLRCERCLENQQVRAWRRRNREKVAAQHRRHYERTREKALQQSRRWREQNPERMKALLANWRKSQAGRALLAAWRRSPKGRASSATAKARRRGAEIVGTGFSPSTWRRRVKAGCWCRQPFTNSNPATLDHWLPISKGGKHTASNIVAAHLACNIAKGNRLLLTPPPGRALA